MSSMRYILINILQQYHGSLGCLKEKKRKATHCELPNFSKYRIFLKKIFTLIKTASHYDNNRYLLERNVVLNSHICQFKY